MSVLIAAIYNTKTPDLYPNNAHHILGWVLTWIMSAQLVMGVMSVHTKRKDNHKFIPVSQQAILEHQRHHDLERTDSYRFSNDSGHGTQTISETSSSHLSSVGEHAEEAQVDLEDEEEKQGLMQGSAVHRFLSNQVPGFSSRTRRILRYFYNATDRVILILGFVALATGGITYGGFFKGEKVFSGLAHFVKGGVFFWYGILTLGRWAGCFSEIGWAWNIKPPHSVVDSSSPRRPSAEFVESFLIFFYGSTNVFLEHMTAWGKEWSAQDLEHVSLTVMFFGGGLVSWLNNYNGIF